MVVDSSAHNEQRSSSGDSLAGARGNTDIFIVGDSGAPRLHFGWGKPMPMIRQSEAAECGPACLAMIAGYFGQHVDLAALRRRFPLSLKGIRLEQLVEMAQTLGLACRPLRLDLDELSQVQTPCIMHWDMDHFVVLRTATQKRVVVHDPAVGIRRLRISQVPQLIA